MASSGRPTRRRALRRAHRADASPPRARRCCASSSRSTRGRGPRRSSSASSRCARRRAYFVARIGRDVVGLRRADDDRRRRARHDHRRRPALAPPQDRHPAAARARPRGDRARGAEPHARGAHVEPRAPRSSTAGSASLRSACARTTTRRSNEDALVMWAHEVDRPEYSELLDWIERRLPARRVVEERRTRDASSSGSRRRATRPRPRWWRTAAHVRSSVVSSQVDLHARFGGVVPELASRAHVELITPVDRRGARGSGHRSSASSTPSPPATDRASPARCSSA